MASLLGALLDEHEADLAHDEQALPEAENLGRAPIFLRSAQLPSSWSGCSVSGSSSTG